MNHPKALPLGTPQVADGNIISCVRFACWINKATDTNSEYIILNGFYIATMVAQTHLNATFIGILPVVFPICFPFLSLFYLRISSLFFSYRSLLSSFSFLCFLFFPSAEMVGQTISYCRCAALRWVLSTSDSRPDCRGQAAGTQVTRPVLLLLCVL